jgi:hypothetical protein
MLNSSILKATKSSTAYEIKCMAYTIKINVNNVSKEEQLNFSVIQRNTAD